MKKILEQVLPLGVINRLKYLRSMLVLCQHAFWEKGRYFRFHGCNNRNDQVQLGAKIMLFTHEIQKGLSHTDFRYCFGSKPIHNLSNALKLWHDNNYPRTNMNYIAGIRCLRAYKEKHLNAQVELPDFFLEETKEFSNEINDLRDARSTVNVRAAEKAGNTNKKFLDLFLERSSTREYASEEPDPKDILKAVQYASKSPSMCNRQPSRVIVVSDPDTIKRALDIQGGMRGYKYPPLLLAIVVDVRAYLFDSDSEGCFIDGGLFSMSLLLTLENESIAACPLSTTLPLKREKQLRKVLNVPDYENLIMLISAGRYPETTINPRSERYSANEIIRFID